MTMEHFDIGPERANSGLIYVRYIGKNNEDEHEYDFYFSNNVHDAHGDDWDLDIAGHGENMEPYDEYVSFVERVRTGAVPLFCAQDNRMLSMRHVTMRILALAWEDISEYDVYPEPYRLVFHFGDKYTDVFKRLKGREIVS